MKRMAVLVCAGLLFALPGYADEGLVIAVGQGNPPYMFLQAEEADGIYPALLNAIFNRMGVDVDVKAFPWKRALKMGKEGEVGIGGIYKTTRRLRLFDYSAPLYTERIMLYVRKGAVFEFNTVSDLEGKMIGGLLGWSYGEAFDYARHAGPVRVYEVSNDKMNFHKLVNGRLDGVLAPELTGELIISREGYQEQVIALAAPVAVNETYLVFAKQAKKKNLLEQFNTTLKAMKEDGSYETVIRGYLNMAR